MFILGHIGIGRTVAWPWSRKLPVIPFVIGALLPDIIDKPLFYLHLSAYVSCTRTFAHTGLFAAAILTVALVRRSPAWMAVALGVATHLLLDCAMDAMSREPHSAVIALGWPFLQARFANYPFRSAVDHIEHLLNMQVLVTELLGLGLIAWEFLIRRRRQTA